MSLWHHFYRLLGPDFYMMAPPVTRCKPLRPMHLAMYATKMAKPTAIIRLSPTTLPLTVIVVRVSLGKNTSRPSSALLQSPRSGILHPTMSGQICEE